ncbi:MAG TPA: cell division protein FtsQ/DivIB [Burkholderiaceae bacterium]|jgi:cell division protein FtsQ
MAKPAPVAVTPPDIRLMNATALVFAGLAALAFAGIAALWIAKQPVFALKSIRLEGDMAHNSALTIRANAAPKLVGNFFTLDIGAARRAFEAVPWVRQAIVRRVWPNRLAVQLEEHRAAALWGGSSIDDDAPDKLVNSFGEVFEANMGDVEDDSLPTLRGPDGSSSEALTLYGLLQPVFALMNAHIDTLALSGRGSWRVELDTGAEVELGRGTDDEVVARTKTFVATLPQVTGRYGRALQSADLRHRDGYAVKLEGITTTDVAGKSQKK